MNNDINEKNQPMQPILSTMVYCIREDQVLLMRRNKEPNLGLWVAPGGKLEPGESPFACAQRELKEETNLLADSLMFRGLVTESSPRPDWQWMIFLYVTTKFRGQLMGDDREGLFSWKPISDVLSLDLPEADRLFLPRIIDLNSPFYQAHFEYDKDLNIISAKEYDD